MIVVTEPGILNQIRGKIVAAQRRGDKVKHIIVTSDEFMELSQHVNSLISMFNINKMSHKQYANAAFKTINLSGPAPFEVRTFATQYQFEGHDLFVVPKEYHPQP